MLEDLWNDDKLGRQDEARALERFLVNEAQGLIDAGLDHSYVLGLDSPYGVGKTWFLQKFKEQIAAHGYPVAFVDAWADDAGDQPMVAIMAAIEDALKPHLGKRKIKDNVAGAVSSLGVILYKGTRGLIAKGGAKYIGDAVSDEIAETIREAASAGIEAGVEDGVDAVGEAVDGFARKAINAYNQRRKSVKIFKNQLLAVHKSISGKRFNPIFVIVDELDRCRPTYVIKLLEEIKHLFDVRGLVFVIALHGKQLEKALSAVYGPKFEGD